MLIVRTRHQRLAVCTQRTSFGRKLSSKRTWTRTSIKHLTDLWYRNSNKSEPNQSGEDLSTNNLHLALVYKTTTQFLFSLSTVWQETPYLPRASPSAMCYHYRLPLPTDASKISICAEPTYRCQFSFKIVPPAIHIMQCLVDIVVELSLVEKTLMPQLQQQRINRGSLPKLPKATKQALPIENKIFLHFCFRSFCVRVWLGITPN